MSARLFWLVFGLLFLVACSKRLLTFALGPGAFVGDSTQYWALGEQVAAGDWLLLASDVDYRTPLYPMFLGLFQRAFDEDAMMAVVIVQHLLMMGTSLLVALACWQTTRIRVATLVAYGLSVACLTRAWFANTILTEPLFAFFLTATVCALTAYHRRPSFRASGAFALLLGLTVMVRPVPKLLWLPLVALFFLNASRWAEERLSLGRIAKHAFLAIALYFAVLAPWYARNWVRFEELFLARLPTVNKWQVCFQGGSAARLPIPDTPAGRRLLDLIGTPEGDVRHRYCRAAIEALAAKGLSPEETDQLVTRACLDAIREHPVAFAWPAFKRFVNFWRTEADGIHYDHPKRGHHRHRHRHRHWRVERVAGVYDGVLRHTPSHWWRWNETVALAVACGTLLMVLVPGTRAIGLSLAAIFLYFSAVTAAVEVENYKYRMILEPSFWLAIVCGFRNLNLRVSRADGALRFDVGPYSVQIVIRGSPKQRPTIPTET